MAQDWTRYLQRLKAKQPEEALSVFQRDYRAGKVPARDDEDLAVAAFLVKLKLDREGGSASAVVAGRRWLCAKFAALHDDSGQRYHSQQGGGRRPLLSKAEGAFPEFATLERVETLDTLLERRVVGQTTAVSLLTDSLQMAYLGLRDPEKPLGVFLLIGPTGCGKTELAKALGACLFGSKSIFRIDMGAFKSRGDVSTLIGSPKGYQDSKEGGMLTTFLSKQTEGCVVLLDECEKAHSEVLDIFLPAFDEGFITDARGVRHNAKQVVFILTSNLGSDALQNSLEEADTELKAEDVERIVSPIVHSSLRPELLGRIDDVAYFKPLSLAEIGIVCSLALAELRGRLERSTSGHLTLTWTTDIVDHLVRSALSLPSSERVVSRRRHPQHGARGVKRQVRHLIAVPITKFLLRQGERLNREVEAAKRQGLSSASLEMYLYCNALSARLFPSGDRIEVVSHKRLQRVNHLRNTSSMQVLRSIAMLPSTECMGRWILGELDCRLGRRCTCCDGDSDVVPNGSRALEALSIWGSSSPCTRLQLRSGCGNLPAYILKQMHELPIVYYCRNWINFFTGAIGIEMSHLSAIDEAGVQAFQQGNTQIRKLDAQEAPRPPSQ